MKNKLSIKRLFITFLCVMLCAYLSSCGDTTEDGIILIDPNTGSMYLLRHHIGDTYFIYKRKMTIVGKDTIWTYVK